MSITKYERILGTFVVITILLALILFTLIKFNDEEVEVRVIEVPANPNHSPL